MQVLGGRCMHNRNAVPQFGDAESVVGIDEHFDDGFEGFQATAKTATATSQNWDISAQIGFDTLDIVRIFFVAGIAHMIAGKHHVKVAAIAVRTVKIGFRRAVHDVLNARCALVHGDLKPNNHTGFRANHGHQVDVFLGFGIRFFVDEPVQLIELVNRPRFSTFQQFFNRFF